MLAAAAATLVCLASLVTADARLGGADDPGYAFARSLALAGPRPAAGRGERRAHERVAAAFRTAGLAVAHDRFAVPGKGRSRNVIGVLERPRACLWILMAHADTVPPSPGAEDNASGVGALVALAPRVAVLAPRCDVWLVATGAEERIYTGQPDHLGASALVRRVQRRGRAEDLRWALSLDEVGRGRELWLRSPRLRRFDRRVIAAARGSGLRVRWVADDGPGNSDHREFGLAGLTAGKLGVPDNPLRHTAADVAARLQQRTFPRVRRLLEALLGGARVMPQRDRPPGAERLRRPSRERACEPARPAVPPRASGRARRARAARSAAGG